VKELQKQVCGVLAQPEIDIAGFGDAEQMLSFVCILKFALSRLVRGQAVRNLGGLIPLSSHVAWGGLSLELLTQMKP
jgi:hypothetical protein